MRLLLPLLLVRLALLLPKLTLERELTPAAVSPLRPGTPGLLVCARGDTATGTATDPRALPTLAAALPALTPAPITSVMLTGRPAPAPSTRGIVCACAVTAALFLLPLRTSATARMVPAIRTPAPTAPPMMAAP